LKDLPVGRETLRTFLTFPSCGIAEIGLTLNFLSGGSSNGPLTNLSLTKAATESVTSCPYT